MTSPKSYVINVIRDRCKECGLCINVCPQRILERGEEYNSKGFRFTIVREPRDCIGCRLCEWTCPDFAIFVEEEEKAEFRVIER